jgi:hypothetical protein
VNPVIHFPSRQTFKNLARARCLRFSVLLESLASFPSLHCFASSCIHAAKSLAGFGGFAVSKGLQDQEFSGFPKIFARFARFAR